MEEKNKESTLSKKNISENKSTKLFCKLTNAEFQKRKESIMTILKPKILDQREHENGYAFKFPGTDKVFEDLLDFIKSERECCDFFDFNLSIKGDKSEIWLELTGDEGVKAFISTELSS